MKFKDWFWGLFFVIAAGVIIASQFGLFKGIGLFTLICTVLLIPIIIKSLFTVNFFGIFFSLTVLALIYKEPLGIASISPWAIIITAILASIGFSMIFHKKPEDFCHVHTCVHKCGEGEPEVIETSEDGEVIDIKVHFGSAVKYIKTENLKQVNLSTSFGAASVYFDNAKIPFGTAKVNLDVSFSGVELYIPKTWKVVNNADTALGGIDEKNRKYESEGPTLVIDGNVRLGGVEIIYV